MSSWRRESAFLCGCLCLALFAGGCGGGEQEDASQSQMAAMDESASGAGEPGGAPDAAAELSAAGLPVDASAVVARVDGEAIHRGEVDLVAAHYANRAAQSGAMPSSPGEYVQQALDQLIDQLLLAGEARRQGYSVADSIVEGMVSQWRMQFPSEEALEARLQEVGIGLDHLREKFRLDALVQNFIDEAVRDTLQVSDADLQAYYEGNQAQFQRGETVHARHILIEAPPEASAEERAEARQEAQALQERAAAGEDFATLAREHSACPSAPAGGDLGFFTREQMVAPFASAAFALAPGELSDVVETRFGYHVIKVEEHREAGAVPLADVADRLRQVLEGQRLQEAVNGMAARLRQDADIEVVSQS